MLKFTSIILLLFLVSCGKWGGLVLEERVQTIELEYIVWGCEFANWATEADMKRYADPDSLADHCVFIEAAWDSLKLPDTLEFNGDLIRFTGSFYQGVGFPEGYRSAQNPDPARVFRYTEYEVLRSNYRESLNNSR